jgi:hypothetical protein
VRSPTILLTLVVLAGLFAAGLFVLGSGERATRAPALPAPMDAESTATAEPLLRPAPVDEGPSAAPQSAQPASPAATAEIHGRVVGAPPEVLATLEVVAVPSQPGAATRTALCGPDGVFALRELAPGVRYQLRAVPAGKASFARTRAGPLEVLAGAREVELRCAAASALLFTVVDGRTGAPLEDFEVRLGPRFLRPVLDEDGRVRRSFPAGRVRCTDLIEPAEGAAFTLLVSARGYEELRRADVFVPAGDTLELGELRLARAPRLVVRVLDERTGLPIADALVSLRERGETDALRPEPAADAAFDPGQGRTDAQGRVMLASHPGTELVLRVRHADYAPFKRELALPLDEEHEVSVRLTPR